MIISERVWESCECCGKNKQLLKEAEYGCDNCRKPVDGENLRLSCHRMSEGADYFEFCSWKCCLEYVSKISWYEYDFLSLPLLSYRYMPEGRTVKNFTELVSTGISG